MFPWITKAEFLNRVTPALVLSTAINTKYVILSNGGIALFALVLLECYRPICKTWQIYGALKVPIVPVGVSAGLRARHTTDSRRPVATRR